MELLEEVSGAGALLLDGEAEVELLEEVSGAGALLLDGEAEVELLELETEVGLLESVESDWSRLCLTFSGVSSS